MDASVMLAAVSKVCIWLAVSLPPFTKSVIYTDPTDRARGTFKSAAQAGLVRRCSAFPTGTGS